MRKCRICKRKYTPKNAMLPICDDFECKVAYATQIAEKSRQTRIKAEKKETRERKEKIKTRSEWLKEAQTEFNKWIRARDAEKACISCDKFASTYDAGHFRSVGAAPQLRFNEDNCHKQCVRCNQHLSGNQLEYRIRLVKRIGLERVEALENDNSTISYRIEEIKEIRDTYRKKLKELKANKSFSA